MFVARVGFLRSVDQELYAKNWESSKLLRRVFWQLLQGSLSLSLSILLCLAAVKAVISWLYPQTARFSEVLVFNSSNNFVQHLLTDFYCQEPLWLYLAFRTMLFISSCLMLFDVLWTYFILMFVLLLQFFQGASDYVLPSSPACSIHRSQRVVECGPLCLVEGPAALFTALNLRHWTAIFWIAMEFDQVT